MAYEDIYKGLTDEGKQRRIVEFKAACSYKYTFGEYLELIET